MVNDSQYLCLLFDSNEYIHLKCFSVNVVENSIFHVCPGIMASRKAGNFQLMIVGGMGKSTLVNALMGKDVAKVESPGSINLESVTKNVASYEFTRNGVRAVIWDTPCLLTCADQDSVLRDIRMVYNNIDLFLLCIRMDSNYYYKVIKCLESQFSKDIWKKSLVVLMFANVTVQYLKTQLAAEKKNASLVASKFNDCMKDWEVLMKKLLGESFLGVVPAGHVAVPKILETDKDSWLNNLWEKCLVIKKVLLAQRRKSDLNATLEAVELLAKDYLPFLHRF